MQCESAIEINIPAIIEVPLLVGRNERDDAFEDHFALALGLFAEAPEHPLTVRKLLMFDAMAGRRRAA